MDSLIHCIYASAATVAFSDAGLEALLVAARPANAALTVTGMLVYSDGSFFQVLEGAPSVVDALFARISADTRHDKVTVVIREPIAGRAFSDWTMGFTRLDRDDLVRIDGLNDFFSDHSCLAEIDPGRARKLLGSFAAGRWRTRVPAPRTGSART